MRSITEPTSSLGTSRGEAGPVRSIIELDTEWALNGEEGPVRSTIELDTEPALGGVGVGSVRSTPAHAEGPWTTGRSSVGSAGPLLEVEACGDDEVVLSREKMLSLSDRE